MRVFEWVFVFLMPLACWVASENVAVQTDVESGGDSAGCERGLLDSIRGCATVQEDPDFTFGRLKKGDLLRAKKDLDVTTMIQFHAPGTGGVRAVLPMGAVVGVMDDGCLASKVLAIKPAYFFYSALEDEMVPEEEQATNFYAGYYLSYDVKAEEKVGDCFEKLSGQYTERSYAAFLKTVCKCLYSANSKVSQIAR